MKTTALSDKTRKRPRIWLQTLIIAITLISVAIVVFLGSRTYLEIKTMATEQFNQQQLILARSAATGINAYFQELAGDLSSLTYLPAIQQISPECLKYMQSAYFNFPSRTSIRLLDRNGVLRYIYPSNEWRGELIGRNYSNEIFFHEAKKTDRIGVFGTVINEQGEARIRIAFSIYLTYNTKTLINSSRPKSHRFQGILVGSFDPHVIAQKFTSSIVSGKTGYAWILNEEGIFFAHHEEGFINQNAFEVRTETNPEVSYKAIEQIQQKMMAGEQGMSYYVSGLHRGEKGKIEKLIAYTPVRFNNHIWSVAVCAPVSEVEDIIYRTQRTEQYTLAFVILALITGGISLFVISYRWSHSLELKVVKRTRELKETSDYLNNLIRYANAPIIVWDPKFRINRFNHAFEHLTGYTTEEVMGKELSILFPETSRKESLSKIKRTLSGEYWESVEIPILRKDGNIRVALWNSANIFGADSTTVIATIAQGIDITERRQAEEAFKETRDYLENLINYASAPIIVWNPDFRINRFNHAFEHLTGYTTEEVMGKELSILFPETSRKESLSKIKRTLSGEYWESVEIPILRKDGNIRVALWNSANIYEEDNTTVIATIAQGIDITERRQTEEALKQSEEKLSSILNSMTDYCYIVSKDYKIEFMNKALMDKFGNQNGKICYKAFFDRESPCPHTKLKEIQKGKTVRWENYLPKLEGTFDIIDSPLKNKDGTISKLGIWRDISERKRAEQQIKASLKEKEVLLREIHHRVKNNLQVISSLLKIQIRATKDKDTIEILSESINRINAMALIHTQLYESKDLSAINMKKFVYRLLKQLLQSYSVSGTKITRFINVVDYPFPISVAVPIGLIINELLTNALKHAFHKRKKGKIEVTLDASEKGKINLAVKDDGIGLPDGFDINVSKTLGLHLVKILVEDQLQGSLNIISKKGTIFKIEVEIVK